MFTKDADIHTIIRKMLYKILISSQDTSFFYENDEELEIITENDVNKIIKKIINEENKKFAFSPAYVTLDFGFEMYGGMLDFKSIADQVVIYDKYKTEESIYENSDIGMKNLWTCSENFKGYSQKVEYGLAEENLYYETCEETKKSDTEQYSMTESDFYFEKMKEQLNMRLEECKKIARENPDKFYILYLRAFISENKCEDMCDLVSVNVSENFYYVEKDYKKIAIDKIIECYRYHNVGFYESAIKLAIAGGEYGEIGPEVDWKKVDNKTQSKVYIKQNMKEIPNIKDVFNDNVDYMKLIKEKMIVMLANEWRYREYTENQRMELVEEAMYRLDEKGIRVKISNDEYENPYNVYEYLIEFSEFDNALLKIPNLNSYIISQSNTRKIEKSEIQNLSLDELNKAYNEIFARYGHSFNNKELKEYFENQSWYYPVEGKTVSLEELNEIEKENLRIIKTVIDEKKK